MSCWFSFALWNSASSSWLEKLEWFPARWSQETFNGSSLFEGFARPGLGMSWPQGAQARLRMGFTLPHCRPPCSHTSSANCLLFSHLWAFAHVRPCCPVLLWPTKPWVCWPQPPSPAGQLASRHFAFTFQLIHGFFCITKTEWAVFCFGAFAHPGPPHLECSYLAVPSYLSGPSLHGLLRNAFLDHSSVPPPGSLSQHPSHYFVVCYPS